VCVSGCGIEEDINNLYLGFDIFGRRNTNNTHFSTLSPALTHLLDEINVCSNNLWGFNFQSVDPHWFKSLREGFGFSIRKVFKREYC
jgi:hypothetical protein